MSRVGKGLFLVFSLVCFCSICTANGEVCAPEKADIGPCLDTLQPHPAYQAIDRELQLITLACPEKTIVCLASDIAPQLYEFLAPTVQRLCKEANISTPPYLFVRMGDSQESYNAQTSSCGILLGENFIRLFLANQRITHCIFSIIAHELGHFFYELQKDSAKARSETLADEFAVTLTKDRDALIAGLTITTVAIRCFNALERFLDQKRDQLKLSSQEQQAFIAHLTMQLYDLFKQDNYNRIIKEMPHNKIIFSLLDKAFCQHTTTNAQTAEALTTQCTKQLTTLYNNPATIKNLVKKNPTAQSTHPPLCERIPHILSVE